MARSGRSGGRDGDVLRVEGVHRDEVPVHATRRWSGTDLLVRHLAQTAENLRVASITAPGPVAGDTTEYGC
jgi:hypothetical protein